VFADAAAAALLAVLVPPAMLADDVLDHCCLVERVSVQTLDLAKARELM
jgi:hypothetical protein